MPSSRDENNVLYSPLPGTVETFWQMIWQNETGIVVMLTKEIEAHKQKCFKYWPEGGNVVYV